MRGEAVGGNKVIAMVVLIIVILGAIVVIVKQQGGADDVPQWVLDQKVKLVSAEKPYAVQEFRQGDIMNCKIDSKTSYRIIEGKLWAGVMTCDSCKKQIPGKAREVVEPTPGEEAPPPEEPEMEKYTCPECGKEAYPDPEDAGAPPPAAK